MAKYEPLTAFLRDQSEDRVSLTFKEVERVLGFKLPASALKHRPWWANTGGSHVQSAAWLDAGFETESVDMERKRLVFSRARPASSAAGAPRSLKEVYGCLAGTIRIHGEVDRPSHEAWADPDAPA